MTNFEIGHSNFLFVYRSDANLFTCTIITREFLHTLKRVTCRVPADYNTWNFITAGREGEGEEEGEGDEYKFEIFHDFFLQKGFCSSVQWGNFTIDLANRNGQMSYLHDAKCNMFLLQLLLQFTLDRFQKVRLWKFSQTPT